MRTGLRRRRDAIGTTALYRLVTMVRHTLFLLLLLLVLLSPLPLGTVDALAWGPLAIVVGFGVAAWSLSAPLTRSDQAAIALSRCWSFVLPFALVGAWSVAQGQIGLPDGLHHPLWADAAAALRAQHAGWPALDPFAGGSALVKLLLPAGIFWLALMTGREPRQARLVLVALAVAGFLYASYGLIIHFSGVERILWFDKTSYLGTVTATFVNRNSYATYAGLGLIVTTGLLLASLADEDGAERGLRARLHALLTILLERDWPLVLAWVAIASALLLTGSRGGLLAVTAGLCTLLAAFALRRGSRAGLTLISVGLILAAGVGLFAVSGETTSIRLAGAENDVAGREHIYALSLQAIAERPLTGWGHGSFPDVFRLVRDEAVEQNVVMAHNSYLELALELGLPAAALLIAAIIALFVRCWIGVRVRRRDSIYPCVGIGATVLVGTHAFVDFSLQIPAVAMTYALIMGVAVAQSWRSGA